MTVSIVTKELNTKACSVYKTNILCEVTIPFRGRWFPQVIHLNVIYWQKQHEFLNKGPNHLVIVKSIGLEPMKPGLEL